MVFNTDVQARFLAHMQAHCREFGAMVVFDPQAGEVQIFKKCHPDATELSTHIADDPYDPLADTSRASSRGLYGDYPKHSVDCSGGTARDWRSGAKPWTSALA